MDLALRIGELLLSSGAGASDVSAAMNNVARSCGLRVLRRCHVHRAHDEPAVLAR